MIQEEVATTDDVNNEQIGPDYKINENSFNENIRKSYYFDQKAKFNRDHGLPGVGRKGPFEGRKIKPRCNLKCRKDCHKITDAHRETIFRHFWSLGDHTRQWDTLRNLIASAPPKSRKKEVDEYIKSRKNFSHIYSLPNLDNSYLIVCKTMFFNTFGNKIV